MMLGTTRAEVLTTLGMAVDKAGDECLREKILC
jgi:hypothetical protein